MKIAIDFDDVLAETTLRFCLEFNVKRPEGTEFADYDRLTDWNVASLLNVPPSYVRDVYDNLDYKNVIPTIGAVQAMNKLGADHTIYIVSSNDNYSEIRKWLNQHELNRFPVFAGVKHKADFYRKNFIDVVVEDNPRYLKGAVTVGVPTVIRFRRPWNMKMQNWGDKPQEKSAYSWTSVLRIVMEEGDWKTQVETVKKRLHQMMGFEVVNDIKKVFGDDLDVDTVVNEAGAKQARLDADFTLLPPLATKEVAKVLKRGAEKYGVDNWKGLSIDEINNHVYNHLLDYQHAANTEDLSHAATRILMALQLHLEAEE